MSDHRLVSIGMPVRNCAQTLTLAVHSLVLQTYPWWELLLIDDGSTDGTAQIAAEFKDPRIRLFADGEARGLPTRLNEAIAASRGVYFGRMDGDDVAYPERLERQVAYLETHPEVDLVGASVAVFGRGGVARGRRWCPERHARICSRPHAGIGLVHPTFVGRLEWFRRFRYRPDAIRCEDQDLLLRAHRSSCYANVPAILLGYREERVDLRKVLTGRFHFARSALREFRAQRRTALACRAAVEQVLKGLVDCIAVPAHLHYRVLRHRASPISDEERQEWARVWALVSHETAIGIAQSIAVPT